MNHLLIDFENVQPNNLDKLDDDNTHIWLFLGANQQKNISLNLCQSLCRFGKKVHFICVKKAGKNALDFYLSFYLGKITEQDPNALIGILSKDGGYDVLLEHITDNQLAQGVVRLVDLDNVQQQVTENLSGSLESSNNQTEIVSYSAKDFSSVVHALRQKDSFQPRLYHNLVSRIKNVILADQWANYTTELQNQYAENIAAALIKKGRISKESDGLIHYHM
ncbi:PIN domain-containing protein [Neisseriaceae bacterium B1]